MFPTPSNNERKETIQSSTCSSAPDALDAAPRTIIAVMGHTGVGKTTFINTASGSNLAIGKGLDSCTRDVQVSEQFELDGRLVTLIDTPGFDDFDVSDVDVLGMIATFLGTSYKEGVSVAGVVYMHRISDPRMTGTSRRNFKMFRELCGENAMKNVVIVTTMWGKVDKEEGESRERELRNKDGFFKAALEKGARMVRHEHPEDVNSAKEILRRIIEHSPLPLLIQEELVDQKKPLADTSAAKEVHRELVTKIEKHEEEKRKLQLELQDKDGDTKRELEQELEENEKELRKVRAEMKKLKEANFWWILSGAAVGGIAAGVAGVLLPAGVVAGGIGLGLRLVTSGGVSAVLASGTITALRAILPTLRSYVAK